MSLTSYRAALPRSRALLYTGGVQKSLKDLHPNRADVPALIGLATVVLVAGLSLPILTVEKTVFSTVRIGSESPSTSTPNVSSSSAGTSGLPGCISLSDFLVGAVTGVL